jgi:hypothetical protein
VLLFSFALRQPLGHSAASYPSSFFFWRTEVNRLLLAETESDGKGILAMWDEGQHSGK